MDAKTTTPIYRLLDAVEWTPTGAAPSNDLPYATHSAVLLIEGLPPLRCYQLNTGERVFDADDVTDWFESLGSK